MFRVEGLRVVVVVMLIELRVVVMMGGSVVMGVEGKHEINEYDYLI